MSDAIQLDGHKLTHHPREVARWLSAGDAWSGVKSLYPIYVEISPFGGCNFRCSFCAKDFLKYKNTSLEPAALKRTLSVMAEKGVKSVYFAGEGEPLLYRSLTEVLDHCRTVGLDAALNTNGSIANHESLRAAVRNCQWIRFSINAGNAEEHRAIHHCREDAFETVFENLAFCVREKAALQSRCVIGAQAVLLTHNWKSMRELARRCRETGVDYLTLKPYSQHPESLTTQHQGTDYTGVDELARELEAESSATFKIYCRPQSFANAREKQLPYAQCHSVPNFWAYIRSNGDVFGCNAFLTDTRFRYGNLHETAFDEIWEGSLREEHFERMKTHDISKCRVNCRMDKVNRYLWELRNPAGHVNFI